MKNDVTQLTITHVPENPKFTEEAYEIAFTLLKDEIIRFYEQLRKERQAERKIDNEE